MSLSTTIHYPFCLRGFLNCYHNFFLCVRKMKKLLHLFCAALKFSLFEIWVNFCCIFFIIWPLCVFLTSSHQLYNLYWLFFNTIHISKNGPIWVTTQTHTQPLITGPFDPKTQDSHCIPPLMTIYIKIISFRSFKKSLPTYNVLVHQVSK